MIATPRIRVTPGTDLLELMGRKDPPPRHCATCRHWERQTWFDRAAAAYGEDDAAQDTDYGTCAGFPVSGEDGHTYSAPSPSMPAIVFPDDSDYGFLMMVAETFTCGLWEREENP